MSNESMDLVKVNVTLGQIPMPSSDASEYAAPNGMTLSVLENILTVDKGAVTKNGFTFNYVLPMHKDLFKAWEAGDNNGALLDSIPPTEWHTPIMTGNTNDDGYTVSATQNLDSAYLACDGDVETCWSSEVVPTIENQASWTMLFPTEHAIKNLAITLKDNQPANFYVRATKDGGVTWSNVGVYKNNKNGETNVIYVNFSDKSTKYNGIQLSFFGAVSEESEYISVYDVTATEDIGKLNVFAIGNVESTDIAVSYSDTPDIPSIYPFSVKIGEVYLTDGTVVDVYPKKDLVNTFIDNDVNKKLDLKANASDVAASLYTKVDKVTGKSLVDDTQIEKLFNLLNVIDFGVQETEDFLDTETTQGFYGYTLSNLPETTFEHKYVLNNVDETGKVTQLVFDGIHTKTRVYTPAVTEPEEVPASWTEWVDNYLITPEFLEKLEEDFAKKADKDVVDAHIANKENPHEVTKAQVGLGSVDNTADLDKPISTATQAALDGKQPVGDYALKSELPDTSTFATKTEVTEGLSGKADKANTLAGYGITDAYTKTESDGKYATTAQGAKADTAVQPAAISDMLTKTEAESTYAKTSSLSTVATSGSYNDLTNKPNIPTLNKIATLLRVNKTGLNETINTGTQKDLLTLVSLTGSADNVVTVANIEATDFTLTSGALKLPNYTTKGYSSTYCDYNIDIRLTGTIEGNVNTSREFALELQRADNTLLERKAVIKVNDTTLGSRGIVFETYTIGADDPFIANGLRLVLNNTSGQTITLTGLSVIIKCVTF